jgi:hypothetical protein
MPDKPQDAIPLKAVQSDKFVSIYSNSMTLDITPWDFKFVFGVLVKGEPGQPPMIENRAEVVMSPQHAKAMLDIFTTHLKEYEKNVGEIKLPQPQPGSERPVIGPVPAVRSH